MGHQKERSTELPSLLRPPQAACSPTVEYAEFPGLLQLSHHRSAVGSRHDGVVRPRVPWRGRPASTFMLAAATLPRPFRA